MALRISILGFNGFVIGAGDRGDGLGWMALSGLVILLVALSSAYLRNFPISTSAI